MKTASWMCLWQVDPGSEFKEDVQKLALHMMSPFVMKKWAGIRL